MHHQTMKAAGLTSKSRLFYGKYIIAEKQRTVKCKTAGTSYFKRMSLPNPFVQQLPKERRRANAFLFAHFSFLVKKKQDACVLASLRKNTAKRKTFLFAHFSFLVKKKQDACVLASLRKNTAKRKTFLFVYYFFLVKKSVWRGAENFSFCILFLLSKEKVGYWAAARAKAFLRTAKQQMR